ncbi:unnamed protein product [Pleuronectes platessa]|uniref:Uncharacterized protein n=1 Tax=Pleuronectes platessa TaxID=8262 RepID=A0A9N7VWL6_PLEPL|nr:unnamed protein product [Pleuronectes platessa]
MLPTTDRKTELASDGNEQGTVCRQRGNHRDRAREQESGAAVARPSGPRKELKRGKNQILFLRGSAGPQVVGHTHTELPWLNRPRLSDGKQETIHRSETIQLDRVTTGRKKKTCPKRI